MNYEENVCVCEENEQELSPRLRRDIIIGTAVVSVMKCLIRYGLMALYIIACDRLGLFAYDLAVKVVVCLTSLALSRWILCGICYAIWHEDGLGFRDVGLLATAREIIRVVRQYK